MTTETLQEYKVTIHRGFDSKTEYIEAKSAKQIQAQLEIEFGYELYEGLIHFTIEKV